MRGKWEEICIDNELTSFEKHMATLEVLKEDQIPYMEPLLEGEALIANLALPVDQMTLHGRQGATCLRPEISAASD